MTRRCPKVVGYRTIGATVMLPWPFQSAMLYYSRPVPLLSLRWRPMSQTTNVNPITEHAIFLRLFITNGGGW